MAAVVEGASELSAVLKTLIGRVGTASRVGTIAAVAELEIVAKRTAPVGTDERPDPHPGELRRSFHTYSITAIGPTTTQALFGPSVIYGRAVEFGLAGKTITAVNAQSLYWPTMRVFPLVSVNWPGFSGRHYLEKAVALALPAMTKAYAVAYTEALSAW